MNHGIVLLICFIVPEIHLSCGEDSKWHHPKPNFGNYVILRNVIQEDYIDLNSIKPDVLMKLATKNLNPEEIIRNESLHSSQNPSKDHSKVVLRPPEELIFAEPSTPANSYFPSNQDSRYESEDDGIHQVKYSQKDKELEATNTKYTKMYSEKVKNLQFITKNAKPMQGNELRVGKEKGLKPQVKEEKQIIYKENKENIVLNKELLNLQKPKPTPKKVEETKKFYSSVVESDKEKVVKSDESERIESDREKIVKLDKVSSMNKDQNGYNNGPSEQGKNSGPMNQTNTAKSYKDFNNNLLQPGNFLIAKVTSKKVNMTISDQTQFINKTTSSTSSSLSTKRPFENTSTTSVKPKTISSITTNHNKIQQNLTKTTPVIKVLRNLEEKVGGGNLSVADLDDIQKRMIGKGDMNDLIQVDVYGAFFNKPLNDTLRQKKNIDWTATDKPITPWKTVDMVLAGFVLLTIFVLGTFCLALRMKKKGKRRKRARELFTDSSEESGGCFDGMFRSPRAIRNRRSPQLKAYPQPERVHLARFATPIKWQSVSESIGTSVKSSRVSWSEIEPSTPVRYTRRASRRKPIYPPPEPPKKVVPSRSASSSTLPSLPTVLSSSTTSDDVPISYSFRNIPGYIPSNLIPSLPTVSSGSSNMSDG